jgi:pimeloyl-ACP methyl ester carboxylesterase
LLPSLAVPRRLSQAALAVFIAAAAGAFAAAPAHAEVSWRACGNPQGLQCGRVAVPLDYAGGASGAVSLNVTRAVASSNPERSAVVALAGGPGQAAAPLAADFAQTLAPALTTRDLLVFDQRGTGQSSPLACGAFSSDSVSSLTALAGRCAAQLGANRRFFTTNDSAQDIESLRVAAGYDKLVIYGVSYGTKVALAYAAAYPQRVERLVLDSVVTPEGPDPLQRSTFAAMKRVLGELCSRSACNGITTSASGDLRRVVRQLARRDLSGNYATPSGRIRSGTFDRDALLGVLVAGDLNPTLRAELPAALNSATRGDRWPLTRLVARLAGLTASQAPEEGVNTALYAATTCEEIAFPWSRDADARTRVAQLRAALNGISSSSFLPFDRATAEASTLLQLCEGWPTPSPAPAVNGNLPAAATLILNGNADLRTPLEDARAVGGRISGSQTVGVPYTGHSVLGSEFSEEDCAKRAVRQFFGGQAVSACTNVSNVFSPVPRSPVRLSRAPSVRGVGGVRGRTLAAVLLTADDVRRQVIGATLDLGRTPRAVGGLRGGRATVSDGTQRLQNVRYVTGVKVSGTVRSNGNASLRVSGGGAASGTVRITGGGDVITAQLGGRRVRIARAGSASLPTNLALPDAETLLRHHALRQTAPALG